MFTATNIYNRSFRHLIILVTGLSITSLLFSQNDFRRYTTKELLQQAVLNGVGFLNDFPEKNLNYALPLIDSFVALKLSDLYVGNLASGVLDGQPDFLFAFGLQIQSERLKNNLLEKLRSIDLLCADTSVRKKIEYGKYSFSPAASTYQYPAALAHALYRQVIKTDTSLLNHAIQELIFWTPFNWEYLNTITKPGLHQLSIRKREFDPCVLASPVNAHLWADIIHYITGQKEMDFGNERANHVYKRLAMSAKKDPDEQKDVIRFGKSSFIDLLDSCSSLESLDIEKAPLLKEKIKKYKEMDRSSVVLYTNGNKGLLFYYFEEKRLVGFSKQYVGAPDLYFLELTSPTSIKSTSFTYRERFLYLY